MGGKASVSKGAGKWTTGGRKRDQTLIVGTVAFLPRPRWPSPGIGMRRCIRFVVERLAVNVAQARSTDESLANRRRGWRQKVGRKNEAKSTRVNVVDSRARRAIVGWS